MNHKKNSHSLLEEMGEIFFLEDINMPHEFSEKYNQQKEELLSTQKKFPSRTLLNVAAIFIGVFCLIPVTVLGAKFMKHYFIKHQDTGKYQDEYTFEKNSEADTLPYVLHVKVVTDFPEEFVREEWEGSLVWNTSDGRCLSLLLLRARENNKVTLQNVTQQTELTLNGYDAVYSKLNTVAPSNTGKPYIYNKNMLIFFEDKGYVLEIWGNDAISEEEFLTLSGQVHLVETTYEEADMPGAVYKTEDSTSSGTDTSNPDTSPAPITIQMNETFEVVFPDYNTNTTGFSSTKVPMKITDARVVNTTTELKDGYFVGVGANNPLISPDGTLSSYSRSLVKSGDGINTLDEVMETETVTPKIIVITCELQNPTDREMALSFSTTMRRISKAETDNLSLGYHYVRDDYYLQPTVFWMDSITRVPDEKMENVYQNMLYLPAQESRTINLAFAIDSDLMENVSLLIDPYTGNDSFIIPIDGLDGI
ncbi:MAG: hypothetical protein PUF12_02560 [Thermoflexaceae bacterium]|nr:hypothetical protein [Thermoflexaceae bacterium]